MTGLRCEDVDNIWPDLRHRHGSIQFPAISTECGPNPASFSPESWRTPGRIWPTSQRLPPNSLRVRGLNPRKATPAEVWSEFHRFEALLIFSDRAPQPVFFRKALRLALLVVVVDKFRVESGLPPVEDAPLFHTSFYCMHRRIHWRCTTARWCPPHHAMATCAEAHGESRFAPNSQMHASSDGWCFPAPRNTDGCS